MTRRPDDKDPSSAEQDYRRQVETLVDGCIARLMQYRLPDDAEPWIGAWNDHD